MVQCFFSFVIAFISFLSFCLFVFFFFFFFISLSLRKELYEDWAKVKSKSRFNQ